MRGFSRSSCRHESGHEKIEYVRVVALIAMVLLITFELLGTTIKGWFEDAGSYLDTLA